MQGSAAKRYNAGEQKMSITAFETTSREAMKMRGYTFRKEQVSILSTQMAIFCIFPCVKPCFFPFRTVYLPSSGYTDPFL
ncbi:YsaB family lipoprotein [Shigella flexneri]